MLDSQQKETQSLTQRSAQRDAMLPKYPIPSFRKIKNAVLRDAENRLDSVGLEELTQALTVLDTPLEDSFTSAAAALGSADNWATPRFKQFLLSLRTPLCENSLTMCLKCPASDQVSATAVLLRGLAQTYTDDTTTEVIGSNGAGKNFETAQLAQMFATTRIPGMNEDRLKMYPTSTHVVLWARGRAYSVDTLDASRYPVPVSTLAAQVRQILETSRKSEVCTSIASLSTNLTRDRWAAAREVQLAENAEGLNAIESAITTIALHDSKVYRKDERMRLARADTHNVYSDKTLGFSIFEDGAIAARVDHTVCDGGFLALFMQVLSGHMARLPSSIAESSKVSPLSEVSFPGPIESVTAPLSAVPKVRKIFNIQQNADVLDLLRSTRMLNIAIQLAFQATVFAVFKNTKVLMSEPTSVRAFREGRCDPNYILTKESITLSQAMQDGASIEELFPMFTTSMVRYRSLMRETKDGAAVGPGIAILRNIVEAMPDTDDKAAILDTLLTYKSPSIFFTGAPLTPFLDAVEAFVFAPNQLAFTYIGSHDKLTFSVGASGSYTTGMDAFQPVFEKYLLQLGTIATATASVEAMYPSKSLPILSSYGVGKDVATEGGTVAIHAGAGEEFGLAPHEKEIVEFTMSIVILVAQQELAAGVHAVDIAQNCVVALENCVFFNAGKGAVLNEEDEHELEASIIDGDTGECGAVAVLQTIMNPVLAARVVMDHSMHPFLTGEAADNFAAANGCATVPNSYFTSHARSTQLAAVRRDGLPSTHPQTVGAAVLDRHGHLAVASSTGGVVNKHAGRIGDTSVVGAGVFANQDVGVACSGQGDAFLRRSVASKIGFQHESTNMQKILDELRSQTGATGAAVKVHKNGQIDIAQTSRAFFVAAGEKGKRAWSKVLLLTEVEMPAYFEDKVLTARLSSQPTTMGDTLLHLNSGALSAMKRHDFIDTVLAAKKASLILTAGIKVDRVALVATGDDQIRLIPLHGVSSEWKSVTAVEEEYNESFLGYIDSKSGPKQSDAALEALRQKISAEKAPAMSLAFNGATEDNNLFARIIRGEVEQWRVWESDSHVAFLTPFPNTPGYTVLIPRSHLNSDILGLADTDLYDLAAAIHDVSALLKKSLGVERVGIIFEGMEIDYAHAKLIPIMGNVDPAASIPTEEFSRFYPGYVSSKPGPSAHANSLQPVHDSLMKASNTTRTICPQSTWPDPSTHCIQALKLPWYQALYHILNTLFHGTVQFFNEDIKYEYALTPLTTDCISSPMGLGSDSSPVNIDLLGQTTYLADSMQFTLEYLLRFNKSVPGVYYIAPSFRGEDPDSTHLNQFFHIECELRGTLEDAMKTAEGYIYSLTKTYNEHHRALIKEMAGTTAHLDGLLQSFNPAIGFPQITLDDAIASMPDPQHWDWVDGSNHALGRKLTRSGERVLISRFDGFVWLTEMDHLSVPFYQAYSSSERSPPRSKAKAADLLMGLGETLGLGQRHATAEEAAAALDHHGVGRESYQWYLDIRDAMPLATSGWGMGSERFLCWLLRHDDVRDMALIPRLKGKKFLP